MEWAPRWGEGTAAALACEGGWLSSLAATSLRPPLLLHPPSSSLAAMLRQPLPSYSLVVARACDDAATAGEVHRRPKGDAATGEAWRGTTGDVVTGEV